MLMSPMYRRVKPLVITVADKTEKRLKNGHTQKLAIPTLALMGVTGWVGGFGPDLKKQANGTSIGRVINGGSVVVLEKLPKTA